MVVKTETYKNEELYINKVKHVKAYEQNLSSHIGGILYIT